MPGTQHVKCPKCEAWSLLEPINVKGTVSQKYLNDMHFLEAYYPVSTVSYPKIVVIECGGCRQKFVVRETYSDVGEVLWPLPGITVPEAIPEKVAEAYRDARLALAAGSKIGALMAGRTALVRLLRDKDVSSFKDLVEKRIITPALYGGADQLRLWADVLGHEDVRVDALEEGDVKDILDYLGTVLEAVYTHPARVERFAERTKEMKAKPKGSSGGKNFSGKIDSGRTGG